MATNAPSEPLEELARKKFGDLSEAELRLIRVAPRGETAFCGPSHDLKSSQNDPKDAGKWGPEREIRAELIRWLCIDADASKQIDPNGIVVAAAKVTGGLDLQFATIPFVFALVNCCIAEQIILRGAELQTLSLQGSRTGAIIAGGVSVKGGIFLHDGFSAEGEVRLVGAQIGGQLNCRSASFKNAKGKALDADGLNVKGDVFLRDCFSAEGEVRLLGAQIGANLDCSKASFQNKDPKKPALNADGANVKGLVLLNNRFSAHGEVRLLGAQIGGQLNCSNASFQNKDPKKPALNADNVHVKYDVFLKDGFSAEGEVRLLGAQIGGQLNCTNASFKNRKGYALNAQRADVKGDVFLRNCFSAEGEVSLAGATIEGGFSCVQADLKKAVLDLRAASVGELHDDERSWPAAGNLFLDGFTYRRIIEAPTRAHRRLKWLRRQLPTDKAGCRQKFRPQPYRQLAKVLREQGHDADANRVLIGLENDRRKHGALGFWLWFWAWILRVTIGYGYLRLLPLAWTAGLVLLGFLIFGSAYRAGMIVPSEYRAYRVFEDKGHAPAGYAPFCAGVYSLDTFLPIIDLGQKTAWMPSQSVVRPIPKTIQPHQGLVECVLCEASITDWITSCTGAPTFMSLRIYRWVHILLGWLFITLFLAGLAGLVRREQ